jgi:hypothetical protein
VNQYTADTMVRITVAITQTVNGAPIDPTMVSLKVKLPDGTVYDITSTIAKDGVGLYHADYTPTTVGLYIYEWIGTGAAEVVSVGQFLVNQGVF